LRTPRSSVPGVVSPAIPGRAASLLLSLLYQFDQTQWLPPAALFAEQARQLRVLFGHAAQTVPFYRRRFADAGVDPRTAVTRQTLERLPIVTPAELAAAGEALDTTALPASHGKRHEIVAEGPAGEPIHLFGTEVTGMFWRACVMREHLWHDRRMDGKLAAIRRVRPGIAMAPLGLASDSWGPASGAVYPTGPAVLLNVDSPLPAQLDWLLREQPDYLISFPTNLAGLARLCLERGVALPRLQQVMTIGEPAGAAVRGLVHRAWGVPLKEAYSCDEAGYLAMQCPDNEVLHVQAENVLLEVVDDAGRPCEAGEVGRVIVTSLHNFATPVIRYDLGELGSFGAPCACGRGLPVIVRAPAGSAA
jgi:phenylacetate-CoA ligase